MAVAIHIFMNYSRIKRQSVLVYFPQSRSITTEQKRQTLDADTKLGLIPILALASVSL